MWEYIIIGAIFSLLVFIVQIQFNNHQKKMEQLEKANNDQQLAIRTLTNTIWSEDKLERSVNRSVKAAMDAWVIAAVKDGTIIFGRNK